MNAADTIAGIKRHLAGWRQWEFNPIVVKELRQAVRSWAVTGMLLLFLGVLFITSLIMLATQSFESNMNQRLGGTIFQTFAVILSVASLTFIPLYVGVRLAAERQQSNLDLLYITALTPQRIIRGKFLCGAYMTVLFFSACMPFMAFTNLLRGIDLPTIILILLCLFLAVCAAVQAAIFLACLPVSRVFKILVALAAVIFVLFMTASLVRMFFFMTLSGAGSMAIMRGGSFWTGFFTVAGIVLAVVVLLYLLSVAMISPLSANRALPIRSYLTVIWVLGAGLGLYWCGHNHQPTFILPWAIVSFVTVAGALVVIVSNNDQLSLRVRRQIPASRAKRALAFLFYNGAAGGLAWLALVATLTYATTCGVLLWGQRIWGAASSPTSADEIADVRITLAGAGLYLFAYALTALLIHRRILGRFSPRLAGVIAVLLPAIWAVIPVVVLFLLNHLNDADIRHVQPGNIFNLLFMVNDSGGRTVHLFCAASWAMVALALNARWFVRQVKDFQPPNPYSAPAPVTPVPPVISASTG